jgi:hypothetical protein
MFLKRPNTEKDVSFPFLKNVKFRSIIIRFVMHYFWWKRSDWFFYWELLFAKNGSTNLGVQNHFGHQSLKFDPYIATISGDHPPGGRRAGVKECIVNFKVVRVANTGRAKCQSCNNRFGSQNNNECFFKVVQICSFWSQNKQFVFIVKTNGLAQL